MTNLEAYRAVNKCSVDLANLMLGNRGINPDAEDQNTLASAFGYFDKANESTFKQGSTSQTIDGKTRQQWIKTAQTLAASVGVTLAVDNGSDIEIMEI